jgi:hypothetical protein
MVSTSTFLIIFFILCLGVISFEKYSIFIHLTHTWCGLFSSLLLFLFPLQYLWPQGFRITRRSRKLRAFICKYTRTHNIPLFIYQFGKEIQYNNLPLSFQSD